MPLLLETRISTDFMHWARLLGAGDGHTVIPFIKQPRNKFRDEHTLLLGVIGTDVEVGKKSHTAITEGRAPWMAHRSPRRRQESGI